MTFPPPSGLSSPDPLTRRNFVQRLIGGTGISAQALRQGGLIAALAGVSTTRLFATTVTPSADVGIDEVNPTGTNNTDTFSVGRTLGQKTDAILFFDGTPTLQDFFEANPGATFNLVLTIDANGLAFVDPILPILIQENLSSLGQTENSANWNHFSGQTQLDIAGGTSMMSRTAGTQVSFDITNFVGHAGNTIRLTLGGDPLVTPDAGFASFASLQHLTIASQPYVEAVGGTPPSASPSPAPASASPSPSPAPASASPTPSGTLTPTPTATLVPTPTPSGTLTPTPTAAITPTPTPSPSMAVSASSTPLPTPTPTPTRAVVPTPTPSAGAQTPPPTPSSSPIPPALVRIFINSLNIVGNDVSFDAVADSLIQQVLLTGRKFDNRGEQNFNQVADTKADSRPFSARDGQVPFIVQASGPDGTYFVSMRAVTSFGYGPASNEVSFILGAGQCEAAPPLQPGPLAVVVTGVDATLTWGEAQGATSYVLEVGSSPGANNVLRTNVGSVTTISGRQLPGTYYVRVRGSNACGDGPSSNEVRVVLTTSESSPGQPLFLAAQVNGKNVLLTWSPPVGGGSVDGYRIQAGTTPTGVDAGEQDLAGTSFFVANVPSGRYYVRVSARNVTGLGPSTPPLIVDVP